MEMEIKTDVMCKSKVKERIHKSNTLVIVRNLKRINLVNISPYDQYFTSIYGVYPFSTSKVHISYGKTY